MGTVAASILAADFANLGAQVAAVEPHVGVFHVDIMDGHFVPPIALGAVIVASLRPVTARPLHGHLMVDQPEGFFDELREAGLDIVSFHLEAVPEPGPAIGKARGAGLGVGLTMNLETPIEAVFPYLDAIDDVMLMSIRPGWSYQTAQRRGLPAPGGRPGRDRPPRPGRGPRDRRRGQARQRTAGGRCRRHGPDRRIGYLRAAGPGGGRRGLASSPPIARGEGA